MLDFGPFAMTRAKYGVTRRSPMLDFEPSATTGLEYAVTRECSMLDFWPGVMPRCSESRVFNGSERFISTRAQFLFFSHHSQPCNVASFFNDLHGFYPYPSTAPNYVCRGGTK